MLFFIFSLEKIMSFSGDSHRERVASIAGWREASGRELMLPIYTVAKCLTTVDRTRVYL